MPVKSLERVLKYAIVGGTGLRRTSKRPGSKAGRTEKSDSWTWIQQGKMTPNIGCRDLVWLVVMVTRAMRSISLMIVVASSYIGAVGGIAEPGYS